MLAPKTSRGKGEVQGKEGRGREPGEATPTSPSHAIALLFCQDEQAQRGGNGRAGEDRDDPFAQTSRNFAFDGNDEDEDEGGGFASLSAGASSGFSGASELQRDDAAPFEASFDDLAPPAPVQPPVGQPFAADFGGAVTASGSDAAGSKTTAEPFTAFESVQGFSTNTAVDADMPPEPSFDFLKDEDGDEDDGDFPGAGGAHVEGESALEDALRAIRLGDDELGVGDGLVAGSAGEFRDFGDFGTAAPADAVLFEADFGDFAEAAGNGERTAE